MLQRITSSKGPPSCSSGFPAAELASLFGNLSRSLTSSTSCLANCSLPESSRVHNAPPTSTPCLCLRSGGRGGTLGRREGGACKCPVLCGFPAVSRPPPPRKLSLALSRDVPGTGRVSDRSCQPRASLSGSPREVGGAELGWGWGFGGEAGGALLPRSSGPARSAGVGGPLCLSHPPPSF